MRQLLPVVFLLTLASSFLLGGPKIGLLETSIWIGIIVYFYAEGVLHVHRLSNAYLTYCTQLGLSTCAAHGDRVWGLYDDMPWLSWTFLGRRWDRKDLQTRELVANFPSILAFVVGYLLTKAVCGASRLTTRFTSFKLDLAATLVLGAGYVAFLHEFTILQPAAYALLNYAVSRFLATRCRPLLVPASWLLGILALAAAGRQLSLESLLSLGINPRTSRRLENSKALEGLPLTKPFLGALAHLRAWGRWMDRFQGELSWFSVLRFWVLRCISWSADLSRSLASASKAEAHPAYPEPPTEHGDRVEASRPLREYQSFQLYWAYLLYAPLYMTGPIISFNAFASYMERPQREVWGWSLVKYWLRWLLNTFLFIAFGHFLYTSALAVNGPLPGLRDNKAVIFDNLLNFGLDGETMIWFSFFSLKGLWFKFLVIWRFARAWALTDGVNSVENMERCMCNNYSVRDFWRGWHRSFNRWLVRYLYVPLGGSPSVSPCIAHVRQNPYTGPYSGHS